MRTWAEIALLVTVAASSSSSSSVPVRNGEKDPAFWNQKAQASITNALNLQHNLNVAKNVIMFLGDGMSSPTLAAARIFKGQLKQMHGEENSLNFESFPHVALLKTYNVDRQVPDSAGTATAFLCGVKSNFETIGVNAYATYNNCRTEAGTRVSSIVDWAQDEGKDTGIVTTARITHATPAGAYAHTVNRDWESDSDMFGDTDNCTDIARQLIEDFPGKNIKVLFGGGRDRFLPKNSARLEEQGVRQDSLNLVTNWEEDKKQRNAKYKYVTNTLGLNELVPKDVDYVLGLFSKSHMSYENERSKDADGEPSIADMTRKAIEILSKNEKGFFLLVEGGRIDHAHHDGLARKALEETLAMDEAVQVALTMTSTSDTLLLVTADHAHVMTFNGYPVRGNDILGVADLSDVDDLPYTTLMYTNGPGFKYSSNGTRDNLTEVDTSAIDYLPLAGVPLTQETHGGDDVVVYAIGPMAHLFHGLQEQNYVPHVMGYAACIGPNRDHCSEIKNSAPCLRLVVSNIQMFGMMLLLLLLSSKSTT